MKVQCKEVKPVNVRKKLGLTPSEMAMILGVHYMTWHKWESERRIPNTATVTFMEHLIWLKNESKVTFDAWVEKKISHNEKEHRHGR